MNDPFALLRQELVAAAGRAPLPAPSGRRLSLPRRSRPLSIVLAALVITGSAAAAVFSLAGSRSQPLEGKVPGAIEPGSVAGYRYTVTVIPSLAAGTAGWESFITYVGNSSLGSPLGGGGGGGYPTPTNPLFGGSCFNCGGPPNRGRTVGYVMTSPQVLGLRIGNRTIRTISSPSLPAGDRVAVFFIPGRGPTLVDGWHPGMPVRGYMTVRGCPCRHGRAVSVIRKIPFVAILPLDRYGHVIATQFMPPYGSVPSFWQAPSAVTPSNHQPPYHGPSHPGAGVCELKQHGLAALHPEFGHTISTISPAKDALGEVFLSCIDTEYYLHGWPLRVAVLLDGCVPGQVLRPIPGARPIPGQPNMVNLAASLLPGSLTAKRVGNAWLVAEGGTGLKQRIAVLNALQISKLDLHHLTSERTPS